MRVLLLSPYPEALLPVLKNEEVTISQESISPEYVRKGGFDMGISYGYRHILKSDVLAVCPFINLHISYLPWNRGADPNLWSWVDDTPKGVTIHFIDEGVDTGDIIIQRLVKMGQSETLKTSYDKLHKILILLFNEVWPIIREGNVPRQAQTKDSGSFHLVKDREILESDLIESYNTPVSRLTGKRKNSASI